MPRNVSSNNNNRDRSLNLGQRIAALQHAQASHFGKKAVFGGRRLVLPGIFGRDDNNNNNATDSTVAWKAPLFNARDDENEDDSLSSRNHRQGWSTSVLETTGASNDENSNTNREHGVTSATQILVQSNQRARQRNPALEQIPKNGTTADARDACPKISKSSSSSSSRRMHNFMNGLLVESNSSETNDNLEQTNSASMAPKIALHVLPVDELVRHDENSNNYTGRMVHGRLGIDERIDVFEPQLSTHAEFAQNLETLQARRICNSEDEEEDTCILSRESGHLQRIPDDQMPTKSDGPVIAQAQDNEEDYQSIVSNRSSNFAVASPHRKNSNHYQQPRDFSTKSRSLDQSPKPVNRKAMDKDFFAQAQPPSGTWESSSYKHTPEWIPFQEPALNTLESATNQPWVARPVFAQPTEASKYVPSATQADDNKQTRVERQNSVLQTPPRHNSPQKVRYLVDDRALKEAYGFRRQTSMSSDGDFNENLKSEAFSAFDEDEHIIEDPFPEQMSDDAIHGRPGRSKVCDDSHPSTDLPSSITKEQSRYKTNFEMGKKILSTDELNVFVRQRSLSPDRNNAAKYIQERLPSKRRSIDACGRNLDVDKTNSAQSKRHMLIEFSPDPPTTNAPSFIESDRAQRRGKDKLHRVNPQNDGQVQKEETEHNNTTDDLNQQRRTSCKYYTTEQQESETQAIDRLLATLDAMTKGTKVPPSNSLTRTMFEGQEPSSIPNAAVGSLNSSASLISDICERNGDDSVLRNISEPSQRVNIQRKEEVVPSSSHNLGLEPLENRNYASAPIRNYWRDYSNVRSRGSFDSVSLSHSLSSGKNEEIKRPRGGEQINCDAASLQKSVPKQTESTGIKLVGVPPIEVRCERELDSMLTNKHEPQIGSSIKKPSTPIKNRSRDATAGERSRKYVDQNGYSSDHLNRSNCVQHHLTTALPAKSSQNEINNLSLVFFKSPLEGNIPPPPPPPPSQTKQQSILPPWQTSLPHQSYVANHPSPTTPQISNQSFARTRNHFSQTEGDTYNMSNVAPPIVAKPSPLRLVRAVDPPEVLPDRHVYEVKPQTYQTQQAVHGGEYRTGHSPTSYNWRDFIVPNDSFDSDHAIVDEIVELCSTTSSENVEMIDYNQGLQRSGSIDSENAVNETSTRILPPRHWRSEVELETIPTESFDSENYVEHGLVSNGRKVENKKLPSPSVYSRQLSTPFRDTLIHAMSPMLSEDTDDDSASDSSSRKQAGNNGSASGFPGCAFICDSLDFTRLREQLEGLCRF